MRTENSTDKDSANIDVGMKAGLPAEAALAAKAGAGGGI
jgi:hypothetical protein